MSARIGHFRTLLRMAKDIRGLSNCLMSSKMPISSRYRSTVTISCHRCFANTCKPCDSKLDSFKYEQLVDETLERLSDEFDRLLGSEDFSADFDTSLSNGVLNVFIEGVGTYVINKQSANQQIWLSSPLSGPKRYDYLSGKWLYGHDGISLDSLLNQELSKIMKTDVIIDISPKNH